LKKKKKKKKKTHVREKKKKKKKKKKKNYFRRRTGIQHDTETTQITITTTTLTLTCTAEYLAFADSRPARPTSSECRPSSLHSIDQQKTFKERKKESKRKILYIVVVV
jgi:hypothetical protein